MPAYLTEGSRRYNRARKIPPHDVIGKLSYYLPPRSDTTPTGPSTAVSVEPIEKFRNHYIDKKDTSSSERQRIRDQVRDATRGVYHNQYQIDQLVRRRFEKTPSNSSLSTSTASSRLATSASSYGVRLSNYYGLQKKVKEHAQAIGQKLLSSAETLRHNKKREEYPVNNLLNVISSSEGSPLNSSGFGEEVSPTVEGASIVEVYPKQHQLNLSDVSRQHHINRGVPCKFRKGPSKQIIRYASKLSNYSRGEIPGEQYDNQNRLVKSLVMKPARTIRVNGKRNKIGRLRRMNHYNQRVLMGEDDFDGNHINPYALSELFSQSEIPGFREIFSSDSYLRKFCWIVAFLFMTILSLNDMTELITEYYEYPITVDVRLRDSARLPFPAVTVCNLNVVRFSSLCSSSNARFDLTNKIPSELRDKLCGIQVEKKKNTNNSDSDITDINNIGIVSTTQVPTSTSSTPSASTAAGNNSINGSGNSIPPMQATASADNNNTDASKSEGNPKSTGQTIGTNGAGNENKNDGFKISIGRPQQQTTGATTPNIATTQSSTTPPKASVTESTIATTVVTSRRTTAKGSLDLDDFVEPSMLQTGRIVGRNFQSNGGRRGRQVRSIAVSDTNSRPFASSGGQIHLPVSMNNNEGQNLQQQSLLSSSYNDSHPSEGQKLLYHNHEQYSATAQPDNWISMKAPVPRVSPWPRAPLTPPIDSSPIAGAANPVPPRIQAGFGAVNSHTNNNKKINETRNIKPNALGNQHSIVNQTSGSSNNNHPESGPQSRPSPMNVTTFTLPPAMTDDFELTERQERELQENLTNWLAVMYNREPLVTKTLGHQFDDMILRCTMKSINCTRQRSFESSFSPTEGNCFTYRSKIRRRQQLSRSGTGSAITGANKGRIESVFEEANLAGTNDGLELVLNLEKNEYIAGSSQVGALVMIHHPSDLGYEASEATFVAPEFTTYIGLKMVNITRLPAPYPESCVDSWPAKFADALVKNSTYSQQTCLKICLQKTIQTHCQCQSAFLPIVELDGNLQANQAASSQPIPTTPMTASTMLTPTPTSAPTPSPYTAASWSSTTIPSKSDTTVGSTTRSTIRSSYTTQQPQQQQQQQRIIICDTRRSATRQCVKEVMFRAADRVHNCECPPKCQVVRYDKTISMARWPTREDKVTFDRGKTDVNFQNLAKVIVYFQTMTCEEVTQQAVFNAAKLFSALGGIMGMYVGFSFLSVFEILEVMSRKVWHHVTLQFTPQIPVPLSNRIATTTIAQPQQPSLMAKAKVNPVASPNTAININNNIKNINSFARHHANFGNANDWPII